MLSILTVVLVGLFVGWWFGNSVDGWKSYPLAILAALVVVPAFGVLAAYLDVMLFGGSQDEQTGIAVGLGLAVAFLEVPLLVFKRKRKQAVVRSVFEPMSPVIDSSVAFRYFPDS